MFDDMLKGFVASSFGRDALAALQKKGIPEDEAKKFMSVAVPGAAEAMKSATAGHAQPEVKLFDLFGGHSGRSFIEGVVAGIVRGDGVVGSLEDGAMGLVGGHVAEVIASRMDVDTSKASMVASILTPFIVHYAHDKLSG